ncbi:MAG: peptidase, partial [Polynucleobacter sp. 35-46-207]
ELQPENPNYEPITFDEGSQLQIWGVVVGVVRKYSHASGRNGKPI